MGGSYRLLLINILVILLISQIHGGYWICDWVNDRGWMYCTRGVCNSFMGKRSISSTDEQTGPEQNHDGTYCISKHFCYKCQPFTDNACRITLQKDYSPILKSEVYKKRSDDDACY